MKKVFKMRSLVFAIAVLGMLASCKDYLDAKPDTRLAVITSIKDMQAMLDYYPRMNYNDPSVAAVCADEYFITDDVYQSRKDTEQNLYKWAPSHVFDERSNAWKDVYEIVYFSNVVLNAVEENKDKLNVNELKQISAQAKFHRARQFLNAIDIWTLPYRAATAATDQGIPLRLDANFNTPSVRATLAESFTQVIADLQVAAAGLPSKPLTPMRPAKAAAYGMLSRAYLRMGNYTMAGLYADSCLQIESKLMDFNTLTTSANFPIAQLNSEVVFESRAVPLGPVTNARALVNPAIYAMYENDDLRKAVYFKASGTDYIFKGQYAGSANMFNGIAVDEMLLTRAECFAQNGKLDKALADLNLLLKNRYKTNTFIPYVLTDQQLVLSLIKKERLKELYLRCLRWADIRRWNATGDHLVLKRSIGGSTFELEPNSLRYALAIPEDIIALSGMQQNRR
jgi:starch-binding outer membrane protein, SusD/RagB family